MTPRTAGCILLAGLLAGPPAAGAQSARPGWGAVPYAGTSGTGVTFRLWAPGAASVNVAGEFNGWSTTANPLALETATGEVWSADLPAARTNQAYKYVVNGSLWRTDPRSRLLQAGGNNNSLVPATNDFAWADDPAAITQAQDLVIYEAHAGTFPGPGGTFASFTNRLDYLAGLGVTAIELMPVNEFPSTTSWGYNPAYPFAVERDYGTPGALKSLVRQAHARNLKVLLDVVHNHWDGDSALWALAGAAPGPYFYGSDPYTWTWWGPRPDYGRETVRNFINDTFRMWVDEYRISGFRWDAPKHILYTTNNVFIPDGLRLATNALALMAAEYPGIWNIAEDTKEINGFDCYWDLTFASEIKGLLANSSDSARDMAVVARNVAGTAARIIFTESHDTTGDLNGGMRLPTAIDAGNPQGYYARKRSQLGLALVLTAPGTPMVFQGQEVLETNQFSDTRAMDWARTNSQAGHWRLTRDLIRLRRNLDGVAAGLMTEAASVYQVDNANKLVAYSRGAGLPADGTAVVVANFANTVRSNFMVQFPAAGTWYAQFNSDSPDYAGDYGGAGSLEVAAAGTPPSGPVTIGPYSALVFSQIPRTGMVVREAAGTDRPAGNGDGFFDPGETIREQVVLWNKSSLAAAGVEAVLTALTPGVTILQDRAAYGTLAPDGVATNPADFAYRLDPALPCGEVLRFQLATAFNGQAVTNVFDHVVGRSLSQPAATNVFASTDTPLAIADAATTYSALTVAEPGEHVLLDLDVRIRINHTYDRDLVVALQHPDGSEVLLVNRRGRGGDNFGTGACGTGTNTVFDQSAATAISGGTAPFAGAFRPEGSLDALRGKPLNGTWRLRLTDVYAQNAGTNLCWSLRAVYEQRTCAATVFSNRAPEALATNLWLTHTAPAGVALSGRDADGQELTFELLRAPDHGTFALLPAGNGAAIYAPVHGFAGTDSVDFAVTDGLATSAAATATFILPTPADANSNTLPDDWEWTHWTNLTEALPDADADGDGVPNAQEHGANTDPRDPASVLRILPPVAGTPALSWRSVGGTRYRVEFTDGFDPAQYQPVVRPLAAEVDPAAYGAPSVQTFTDSFLDGTDSNMPALRGYRVRVLHE